MDTDVIGSTLNGFEAHLIRVETSLSNNLPTISIVGLGNKAIEESKERVRSAVTNSGLQIPRKKITINLAPASLPKQGSSLDLAIAVAILRASRQLPPASVQNTVFIGEMSLDGQIRGVSGILGHILAAKAHNIGKIIIPAENAQQATLSENIEILPVSSLKQLYRYLNNDETILPLDTAIEVACHQENALTFSDINGQEVAKRAMTIAVAGQHNILLAGPPGTGKTMLARAAVSIMPPLEKHEIHTLTHLYSLGNNTNKVISCRPFRSPHHTASRISLVGGGKSPMPGEVSLAHHGILFLDEMLEFPRYSLETLRQPLEDGHITIVRTESQATYPANFVLIGALNPCPCGYLGDSLRQCSCSPNAINSYQKRLSGPLLDRFDLQVNVPRVSINDLTTTKTTHSPINHNELILEAWKCQKLRNPSAKNNSRLSLKEIESLKIISPENMKFIVNSADKLSLSMRAYVRLTRVAITIMDLNGKSVLDKSHILEAMSYRQQSTSLHDI